MKSFFSLSLVLMLVVGVGGGAWYGGEHVAAAPPASAPRSRQATSGDISGSVMVEGMQRTYLLHVPTGYVPGVSTPLVVALHGTGGQGASFANSTGFNPIADANTFLVVYPDALKAHKVKDGVVQYDYHWDLLNAEGSNDEEFMRVLVANLAQTYAIDPQRTYATGMSNGAFFAHELGCLVSDVFVAVAPVAGSVASGVQQQCAPVAPMPVLMMNGTADDNVQYRETNAAFWVGKDACNTTPIVSPLPDTDPNDGTTTTKKDWTGCAGSAEVVQYVIEGGNHSWPGGSAKSKNTAQCAAGSGCQAQDFSASVDIWAFFAAHPRIGVPGVTPNVAPLPRATAAALAPATPAPIAATRGAATATLTGTPNAMPPRK